jgi:hypothetical protein
LDRQFFFGATRQIFHIDDLIFSSEEIMEAAFGETAIYGHLTTLVTGAFFAPASGFLTLMTFSRGFAHAATGAASDAFAIFPGALGRF